jgi:hypothetical protein
MDLYWVYDLPSWLFCLYVTATCIAIGVVGHRLTERWVKRIVGNDGSFNDLVSTTLATVGVFFGITLGLISVGTWQNFTDINANVTQEASSLVVLYRSANYYPAPVSDLLKNSIADYTKYIIEEAWPDQQKGIIPTKGVQKVNVIQQNLMPFEPKTESLKSLHSETLAAFNQMLVYRRNRLSSVQSGLPDTLWWVVVSGAVLNLIIPWFLVYQRRLIQYLMIVMMAMTIGILIFLMGAMDNPFRGEVSVKPDAFRLVYQIMKT